MTLPTHTHTHTDTFYACVHPFATWILVLCLLLLLLLLRLPPSTALALDSPFDFFYNFVFNFDEFCFDCAVRRRSPPSPLVPTFPSQSVELWRSVTFERCLPRRVSLAYPIDTYIETFTLQLSFSLYSLLFLSRHELPIVPLYYARHGRASPFVLASVPTFSTVITLKPRLSWSWSRRRSRSRLHLL